MGTRQASQIFIRHGHLFVIGLFLLASLYRLQEIPPIWSDEIAHMNVALHLAEEGVLKSDFYDTANSRGALFISMPVQWFIMGLFIKVFGLSYCGLRFLYLLLSCVTLFAAYAVARMLFEDRVAVISVSLVAATYIFFNVSRQLLPQVPASVFSVLALWAFFIADENKSYSGFILSGFLSALSFLSHPIGGASIVAITLLFIYRRVRPRYIAGFIVSASIPITIYGWYAVSNMAEYLRQSKWALDSYPNQAALFNIIDEILVRYLGLVPFHKFFEQVGGQNSYVYYVTRFFKNADLRIYFCEMTSKGIFLVSAVYVFLKRRLSTSLGTLFLVSITYMTALSLHPNKFGPYIYVAVPYLAICAAAFINDLASRPGYVRKGIAICVLTIFVAPNLLLVYKSLTTHRIHGYFPFIEKLETRIPKGSVVVGPEYYWLGMRKDYTFIPVQTVVYDIDRELSKADEKGPIGRLPVEERFNILKKCLSRHKIEYYLATWHKWETLTVGASYAEGLHETVLSYLFLNGKKVADFLKERYYPDAPEPDARKGETFFPPEGFDNVNSEYQDGLKVYKIRN